MAAVHIFYVVLVIFSIHFPHKIVLIFITFSLHPACDIMYVAARRLYCVFLSIFIVKKKLARRTGDKFDIY